MSKETILKSTIRQMVKEEITSKKKLNEGGFSINDLKFKDGLVRIKSGGKIIARIFDRKEFGLKNYNKSFPFSLELIEFGGKEYRTLDDLLLDLNKYVMKK